MRSCGYAGFASFTTTCFTPFGIVRILDYFTGPQADDPISGLYYPLSLCRTHAHHKLDAAMTTVNAHAIVLFVNNTLVLVHVLVIVMADYDYDFGRTLEIVHDNCLYNCYPKYL